MAHASDTEQMLPPRVLIIPADGRDGQRMHEAVLECGGTARLAASPQAVWNEIERAEFDLAYLDLTSKDQDGLALIGAMRSHPRTRTLPIIVISERKNGGALGSALEAGAHAFLLKPIDWGIVSTHLDYILRHARRVVKERGERAASDASFRAREAFVGGACREALATTDLVGEIIAKALAIRSRTGDAAGLVTAMRTIDTQMIQLDHLINDAMATAREVTRSVVVETGHVALSAWITDAIREVGDLAEDRSVTLAVQLPCERVVVIGDQAGLAEALVHLLRNGITYAPIGSSVDVAGCVHDDGMVTISITDRGIGMSPEFVARCLTPLMAGLENGRPRKRIGVGLPLAKAVAEAHGGKLEIRSELRAGTCAMLVVPADRVLPGSGARG